MPYIYRQWELKTPKWHTCTQCLIESSLKNILKTKYEPAKCHFPFQVKFRWLFSSEKVYAHFKRDTIYLSTMWTKNPKMKHVCTVSDWSSLSKTLKTRYEPAKCHFPFQVKFRWLFSSEKVYAHFKRDTIYLSTMWTKNPKMKHVCTVSDWSSLSKTLKTRYEPAKCHFPFPLKYRWLFPSEKVYASFKDDTIYLSTMWTKKTKYDTHVHSVWSKLTKQHFENKIWIRSLSLYDSNEKIYSNFKSDAIDTATM